MVNADLSVSLGTRILKYFKIILLVNSVAFLLPSTLAKYYQYVLFSSLIGEMRDITSDDALFNEFACNLVVNSTFQSTTNQMTIQYKVNQDYDTERLVFTYSTGSI